MLCRMRYTNLCLILLLCTQLTFWYFSRDIRPFMEVMPPVPSKLATEAMSFGDQQAYFRFLTMMLQNMGDEFGRVTPLRNYDYAKLYQWFLLLDSLDHRANFVPSIASYYYSHTQYTPDIRYIVDYLDLHTRHYQEEKWWWMAQAVYLANHKLDNPKRALSIAHRLAKVPGDDIPMWARQMPAFIHERLGEKAEAFMIIRDLLQNFDKLSESERNFMGYFIKERIEKMQGK
jgi:hypothetical protein